VAGHQKKARREGRSIVLIDESGFMLQPTVRRTWAPVGMTPVHAVSARHDRLSAIAALTVSPRRKRVGLYFDLFSSNIRWPEVVSYVRKIRRALGRNLYVVWDRLNVHRTAERLLGSSGDGMRFEYLPAYAPQLNPVEQVWSHSKHGELANHLPEDVLDLLEAVFDSLDRKRSQPRLLRNFFSHAELPL
jgi:transposase